MALEGEYEPSAATWVRDQVEAYERSGGREANTLRDTGLPIVIVSMRGRRSGNIRKIGLMRVEHDGEYAFVASKGGAPDHPQWYLNLLAHPDEVMVQDGPEPFDVPFLPSVLRTARTPPMAREIEDPWGTARSLQWATTCPPPRHNVMPPPRIRSESAAFDVHHPEVGRLQPGADPRQHRPPARTVRRGEEGR